MAPEQTIFQRARRPEHKQQRYDAILAAARELALQTSVRDVSLADIGAEVGMHKSALLRYFTTRDEIYLQLAVQDWQDWAEAMAHALADAPAGSTATVAAAFTRTLADRPLLCDLLAHVPLNLERNVPIESARTYKLAVLAAAERLLSHVHRVLPRVADADLWDLLAAVTSVAAGLHQVVHPPPTLAALYREDPQLGHANVEFAASLNRITEVILHGFEHPHDKGALSRRVDPDHVETAT
jgi:AcrR family transcriptional regulator